VTCAWSQLFYHFIWSNPFGLQLVGALIVGPLQKHLDAHIELPHLTFGFLHAFVSSWYFYKFATALSLSGSSRSFSSASLGHTGASVAVCKFQCFTSSGNTASVLYINRNGVKFVALQTIVLWPHTAFSMTSAHLPFFSPSNIFLIASNIKALSLSTAPLADGGIRMQMHPSF
jgi:hypothetical protein